MFVPPIFPPTNKLVAEYRRPEHQPGAKQDIINTRYLGMTFVTVPALQGVFLWYTGMLHGSALGCLTVLASVFIPVGALIISLSTHQMRAWLLAQTPETAEATASAEPASEDGDPPK